MAAFTPCALDNIPLFAKRQIFFSCEQSNGNPQLTFEALDVYYADRDEIVADFCKSHDINYFAIYPAVYSQDYLDAGRIFYEPYNRQILPVIRERGRFVLANVSDSLKVFLNKDYFVVPCDAFE